MHDIFILQLNVGMALCTVPHGLCSHKAHLCIHGTTFIFGHFQFFDNPQIFQHLYKTKQTSSFQPKLPCPKQPTFVIITWQFCNHNCVNNEQKSWPKTYLFIQSNPQLQQILSIIVGPLINPRLLSLAPKDEYYHWTFTKALDCMLLSCLHSQLTSKVFYW